MIHEHLCTCERIPGQTVILEWTETGGAMCCKCHKLVAWIRKDCGGVMCHDPDCVRCYPDDHPGAQDPDPAPQLPAGSINRIGDIVEDPGALRGRAAFVCGSCQALSWWRGNDAGLERMMDNLRLCDAMICPECNARNDIPNDWRVMFL